MKSLRERFNNKYLRHHNKLEYVSYDYEEYFFNTEFYGIPINEHFIVDDFMIIVSSEWLIQHPITIPAMQEEGIFKFQFELEGYSKYTDDLHEIEIKKGYFNLFYLPKVNGQLHYHTHRKCIDIMFDKAIFEHTVAKKLPQYQDFISKLNNEEIAKLFTNSLPIRQDIGEILHAIQFCNLPKSLRQSYFRNKIEELLILAISCTEQFQKEKSTLINFTDEEKALEIKAWVDTNEEGNIRLQEIEERFQISEKVLNKIFKKYYDCTFSQYMRKSQMQKAYRLLKDKGYSINDVAKILRYSYPQHFTVAFTRFYGFSPKEAKQK